MNIKIFISFLTILTTFLAAFVQSAAQVAPQQHQKKTHQPDNSYSQEWGRVVPLDGLWDIEEGARQQVPSQFFSKVPVPGLVTSAKPGFEGVGEENKIREVFWYRKKFKIPGSIPALARLKIFKSMFGTKVFLNGKEVGESELNFTPLYFDVTPFLKGNREENELIIRIGAHISDVPDSVVSGGDPERHLYPPGIYDHVQLLLSGDPYIERTQVVPDIQNKVIKVVIDFAAGNTTNEISGLKAVIYDYKTGKEAGTTVINSGSIGQDKVKKVTVSIPISDCKLWTPATPNLYVLKISNNEYSYRTRFGMRTFMVDSAYTNKALLNDKPCFIRGTNFSIHRFFEDSLSKQYPWDPVWVRQLFKRFTAMEMNGVRFAIGPAPELWYDIADEEGMMVFDEYAIWYAYQPEVGPVTNEATDPYKKWGIWPKNLSSKQLIKEYTAWMQERWNHPCVIVWDAQNETWAKQTGEAIREVRKLDLSKRAWDNGWSPPMDAGDIREAHPYFERFVKGTEMKTAGEKKQEPFSTNHLSKAEKIPSTFYLPFQYANKIPPNWYWKQPCIINEYSYLWLNRDGSPTELTKPYYDTVLGTDASPGQRRELYARNLAAVTEYWRATRSCIGILYPFGLASSIQDGATSDNFIDVENLHFDEFYKKFVPDAFAALGICAELWGTEFNILPWHGTQAEFSVAVINDMDSSFSDYFTIKIIKGNSVVSSSRYRYKVMPYEINRTYVKIELPKIAGSYEMIVELHGRKNRIVRSYRQINILP